MQNKKLELPLSSGKVKIFCLFMLALILFSAVLSILYGSVTIKPDWITKIVVNKIAKKEIFAIEWAKNIESIVWTLRMPRILMSFIVGASLSLSGVLMQALTKNSLADPYVLGISSGASTGAVAAIIYGVFGFMGSYGIVFGAIIGSVVSIALALSVSSIKGKITSTQLVLSGIAVSAMFAALTNIIIYSSGAGSDKIRTALFWMMGSLSSAKWNQIGYIFMIFVVSFMLIYSLNKSLDAMLLGDDVATTIGVDLDKIKPIIIILCSVLTGTIVSVSGTIGFVGLVIPHITRLIVGANHKKLIPATVLVGGFFLIICDLLSRVIVAPEEVPIGVVTAVFGAPFFLFLIRKRKAM